MNSTNFSPAEGIDSVPRLAVGIVAAPSVDVCFIGGFSLTGWHRFDVGQLLNAPGRRLDFLSEGGGGLFEIADVTIGIGFHWQQQQTQRFVGDISLIVEGDCVRLVNYVDVETYLASVISSEMSATASGALLRAHAVISRSWVLSQIGNKRGGSPCRSLESGGEIVRWYDRDDHEGFDVCADDHCQRYQGITRQSTPEVSKAVDDTRGEVLTSGGELCDARFSKCCGGVMEEFSSCWESVGHPYLRPLRDTADEDAVPDLRDEEAARRWITSSPDSFCNTSDPSILRQVLNGFDRATPDFYRWTVSYDAGELSEIVSRKSGLDFGRIVDLQPLRRGPSGRIVRLKIVGEKLTMVVGKELEIRRWLSPTHLYSSAFVVDRRADGFTLRGSGWGHGVGLCQIGAAVMGERGYGYREILAHYYPGSEIEKRY